MFEAIAYPTILVATRRGAGSPPSDAEQMRVLNWTRGDDPARFAERVATDGFAMPLSALQPGGWQFEPRAERDLLARLRAGGVPLGEWFEGRFYRGILTGLNEAFVLNEAEHAALIFAPEHADVMKPFLRGRDVKCWGVEPSGRWLVKLASSENETHPWSGLPEAEAEAVFARTYPAIYEWFTGDDRREKLIARADQGRFWWELRSCAYYDLFEQPKIIYPDIYERQSFAFDTSGSYSVNTTYFIPTDARWLTAILNSNTVEHFYRSISNSIMGGYMRAFTDVMRTVPIPRTTPAQEAALSLVVDALVAGAQRPRLEALINALVYELFFPDLVRGVFAAADAAGLGRLAGLEGAALARAADDWSRHLADPAHPLYAALFDLQALDVVRTIEGR